MEVGTVQDFWGMWADNISPFTGMEFVGVDFSPDLDAPRRIFTKSCFSHSQFVGADLMETEWAGAILENVQFVGCDLSGADFRDINAKNVSFVECDLDKALFNKAVFSETLFDKCTGKITMEGAKAPEIVFRECDLEGSSFDESDLTGGIFMKSCVEGASFTLTILEDLSFYGSLITDASIFGASNKDKMRVEHALIYPVAVGNTSRIPAAEKRPIGPVKQGDWIPWVEEEEKPATLFCSNEDELKL